MGIFDETKQLETELGYAPKPIATPSAKPKNRSVGVFDEVERLKAELGIDDDQLNAYMFESRSKAVKPVEPMVEDTAFSAFSGGMEALGTALKTGANVLAGNEIEAREAAEKKAPRTESQQKFTDTLYANPGEEDTWWESIKNVASTAVSNPKGAFHEMLAQIPNSIPSMVSMATGAKLGAMAGAGFGGLGAIPGAITGGIIGHFVGTIAVEGGHIAVEELQDPGAEFDRAKITEKAVKKGATIAIIDTLSFAITAGVGKVIFGPAMKAAQVAIHAALKAKGINPLDKMAYALAVKSKPGLKAELKAIGKAAADPLMPSKKVVAGLLAGGMGLEMVSEGGGEYLGTMAMGDEPSKLDATLEGFMALFQGGAHTVIGTAAGKAMARFGSDTATGTQDSTPRVDPRRKTLYYADKNPDDPSLIFGSAFSGMTTTQASEITTALNNLEDPKARLKAVDTIEKEIIKAADTPAEGRRRAAIFANEALAKIESKEEIRLNQDLVAYAAMDAADKGHYRKEVRLGEYTDAIAVVEGRIHNLSKLAKPTPQEQENLAQAQATLAGLQAEKDLLTLFDPEMLRPKDQLSRKAEGTTERDFDPATFTETSEEDWAMAKGQPLPGSTDQDITDMRKSNDRKIAREMGLQGQQDDRAIAGIESEPDFSITKEGMKQSQDLLAKNIDTFRRTKSQDASVKALEARQQAIANPTTTYQPPASRAANQALAGFEGRVETHLPPSDVPIVEGGRSPFIPVPGVSQDNEVKFHPFAGLIDRLGGFEGPVQPEPIPESPIKVETAFRGRPIVEHEVEPEKVNTSPTEADKESLTVQPADAPDSELLKIGDKVNVGKIGEAVLTDLETAGGVFYELYTTADGKGALRIYDVDSEELVFLNTYPDVNQAKAEFDGAVRIVREKKTTDTFDPGDKATWTNKKGEELSGESVETGSPEGWRRVPGGGFVSDFANGQYLIYGEPGKWRVSDESIGRVIGGTYTNPQTAAAKASQHWIESQRSKPETPSRDVPETNFGDMVETAARWRGAAMQVDRLLGDDTKARLKHSRSTTKGDLEAYLMKKYGLNEVEAREVSNELTRGNIQADMTASLDEFKDEPWMVVGKEPKTEPKTPQSKPEPTTQDVPVEKKNVPAGFDPDNLLAEFDKEAAKVTAQEKAQEAKQHMANAMDKIRQINDILGDRGSFSTDKTDENIYAQLKPLLQGALNDILMAGKSAAEFAKIVVQSISPKGRIYFERFVRNDMVVDRALVDGYNKDEQQPQEVANVTDNDDRGAQGKAEDDIHGPGGQSPEKVSPVEKDRETDVVREPGREEVDGGLGESVQQQNDGVEDQPAGERNNPERDTNDGERTEGDLGTNPAKPPELQRRGRDHRIEPGEIDRKGGWKQAAKENLDAIELSRKILSENRPATLEEQKILARYVGWGSTELANNMFPGYASSKEILPHYGKDEWRPLVERLMQVMSPEEIKTAASSTKNAHYTSTAIVSSIYNALERMGFKGGKILEPGMGVGNFVGLLPDSMRKGTTYTGVEMDLVSARIAKLLYPDQNMIQGDFTKQILPKNFFDAAIGNPPFGSIPILADPEYRKFSFPIHNYFFAKSIDRVRPGGIMALVTSRYTMDSKKDRARQYLADRADLVGAIRLPQTAFKENAGTEVVTDVLFFQKRAEGASPSGQAWTQTKEITIKDKDGVTHQVDINEYFADHPEMVLGRHSLEGKMYSKNEYTVMPADGRIEDLFSKAVQNLPKDIYSNLQSGKGATYEPTTVIERDFNPKNKKEKGIYLNDKGELMRVESGSGTALKTQEKITEANEVFLKAYVGLRDKVKASLSSQLTNGDWESALKGLNKAYDAFVKKHGNLLAYTTITRTVVNEDGVQEKIDERRFKHQKLLGMDAEYSLVWVLEKILDDGSIVKGSSLQGRTLMQPTSPTIKTAHDALAVSLSAIGRLDVDHVAKLYGKTSAEVVEVLGDLLYTSPENGQHVMADEYLSGDVVQKLVEAREAAKADPQFERNVQALEKVQPEPLTSKDIHVTMGGTWIPMDDYNRFAREVLEMRDADISYDHRVGSWTVSTPYSTAQGLRSYQDDWSTLDRGKNEIMDAILNNRSIKITRKDDDGKVYTDAESTAEANEVARKMRERFSAWVWEESDRSNTLLDIYNTKFNNLAGRKFDGSHLTLPGVSLKVSLHQHQKDAIWRIIQTGNVYLNHAVGAGKTYVMIAAAMEMKRLGLVRKPMFAVPRHMLAQFSQEFQELYPAADILIADAENFHKDNRKRFVAQAAMNNPDAIIMTHPSFKLIKSSEENISPVRDEFIQAMLYALEDMRNEGDPPRKIKQAETLIEKAEQRFNSMIGEGDNVVTFEEMGVDFLFVDEAHEFRKLDFSTSRQIKGIDPSGSKAALDLYVKTVYLESLNKGRSHLFASGTPIVNTVGEMFSLLRFFDKKGLERDGVEFFDSWANMFGLAATDYEMNSAGRFELVERFAKFVNVPELMSRVRQFTDVLTSEQLGTRVERPSVRGGAPEIRLAPKTTALQTYQKDVLEPRIESSKAWRPSRNEPGNPDPIINIITDGRLASIDLRFVDNTAANDPNSKLNQYIDGIIKTYQETKDNEFLTPDGSGVSAIKGGAQIAFYNLGFGESVAANRGFSARNWFMRRMNEAGIPAAQVGWIDDADTDVKKQALFKDIREGRKRILIGSAKKMGTGVNAQTRLTDLHYLDAPWFPADVEQPEGRIIRQGNQNKEVGIYRYATEGSYDATMWQMVARKARMITQAWSGDKSVRSIEDLSEVSQYAMAAAMASGDTRMIELVQLEADVTKLEMLRGAHIQKQTSLHRDARNLAWDIKSNERQKEHLVEARKKYPAYLREFSGEIDGQPFAKRDEFNDALRAAIRKATIDKDNKFKPELEKKVVGQIHGATITVSTGTVNATVYFNVTKNVASALPGGYLHQEDFLQFIDESDFATRGMNYLNRLPTAQAEIERMIKDDRENLERTRKFIGAPFPQDRELAEKREQRDALGRELGQEGQAVQVERQNLASQALENAVAADDVPVSGRRGDGFYLRYTDNKPVLAKDASPIRLEGYESVSFFIHKREDGTWGVVEQSTGLMITADKSKTEAKAASLKAIKNSYPDEKELVKYLASLPQISDAQFSTLDDSTETSTGQKLNLQDIRKKFEGMGQKVSLLPDGSILIRTKNGLGLKIKTTDKFSEGDVAIAMQKGRMSRRGQILGKYESQEITLNELMADSFVLDHETYHFLADFIFNSVDRAVILNKAKQYQKAGKFKFTWNENSMEENEANAFAQFMDERQSHRGTVLGRILQKFQDFIDGLKHIGEQSAVKIARQVESGKVFDRKAKKEGGVADQKFTFAGPEARTADKGKAFEAQQMRDAGASRREVWDKTGWWEIVPGSDQWAFEIDDTDGGFKKIWYENLKEDRWAGLSSLYVSKELFAAYDFLYDVNVYVKPNLQSLASYDVKLKEIHLNPAVLEDRSLAKATLLHEVQHAIQVYEGFSRGGSVFEMSPDLEGQAHRELLKTDKQFREWYDEAEDIDPYGEQKEQRDALDAKIGEKTKAYLEEKYGDVNAYRKKSAKRSYLSLTGEAQSRLVQKRLDMTAEEKKAEPPWETLEKMMREEGLIQEGQKPEDVLISRDGGLVAMNQESDDIRFSSYEDRAEAYEINRRDRGDVRLQAMSKIGKIKGEIVRGTDKFLGAISTRLKWINPKLSEKIRRLDYDIGKESKVALEAADTLFKKTSKMTKNDAADWDLARKDSDKAMIDILTKKYGIEAEYKAVRDALDAIRKRAIAVGYNVGKIEEYWPRVINNQEAFLKAIGAGPERPVFTDALKQRAKEMGLDSHHEIPDDMRADIISNVILGKYYGIPGPGAVKRRVYDNIPPELVQYYMTSDAALVHHIHAMNKRIEARRFFGKASQAISEKRTALRRVQARVIELSSNLAGKLTDKQKESLAKHKKSLTRDLPDKDRREIERKIQRLEAIPGMSDEILTDLRSKRSNAIGTEKQLSAWLEKAGSMDDFNEHIGAYIIDLIDNKEIKTDQENAVKDILTDRFKERGATGLIQAYKNFSYIDTMGSIISAVTQIGDLAWAAYEGGFIKTIGFAGKSLIGKSRIKKEDVGINRIAQEFADTDSLAKVVRFVFKWVGLEKMDSIGKEALLAAAFDKYKKKAMADPAKLKSEIKHMFEGETDSVIQDLLNNDVTENVKYLVYNRLLDFQPMALSEMPQAYLTAGNGRIFYMLKSFTIKQLDIFRREVYQDLRHGDMKQKAEAMKRLVYLGGLFVLANAAADEIKDWLLGRETDLQDRVVDNFLRLLGISKYITWQARTEGLGTAMGKTLLPPFKFLNATYKDVITAGDDKGLEVVQSVPIVGKLAYWHMGRGVHKRVDLWDNRLRKEKARLEKMNERLDRAENKPEFIRQNRADFIARKKVNSMQGTLNTYRKKINILKSREQTQAVINRIEKLESARTEMIKKYFEKKGA